jgi:ATP-dependent Clp protease adaptor protein ClpS
MPFTEHESQTITETQLQPPSNVIVHNDPVNLMPYVVMVFQTVLHMNKETAIKHMLEVHKLGRSVVWTGEREQAESYTQALQHWNLTVTMENAA